MNKHAFEIINQFDETYSDPPPKVRESARALVIKDGKILLTYEANIDNYMSPGGGVEEGETLEECCIRELREESGFEVKPVERFVTVNEFSLGTLYISNYFLCEVTGECEQCLTPTEIDHGVCPRWLTLDEAVTVFSTYAGRPPDKASLYLREYTVLSRYLEKIRLDTAISV
ncbi:MAG: NUDIX domain-containing protein [Clostridia bacterium]|nr:NUDIX domain-containing protein [Clostridia bacterium]